jgi:protein-disulfide isomerase
MIRPKAWINHCAVAYIVLQGALLPSIAKSDDRAPNEQNVPTAKSDIQTTIHDYILAHPEVLIESLQQAKRKDEERQAAATKSFIGTHKKELLEDSNSPVLGNRNGDVTLVEFFDYRCPYCRQVDPLLRRLVSEDPKVRIVQKQLPILGPTSVLAARAALAANNQGKHEQLHDALMTEKPNFDEARILKVAGDLGLDLVRFKADMASPEVDAEILGSARLAKGMNLTGTPAFIVGLELVPGATNLETLKSMIDDAREDQR